VSVTVAGTPAADGFRMPGEYGPHAGCWMAWPERGDLWRLQAGPAQEAFAAVAEAIAVSEPVTMGVSDRLFESCRAALSPSIRVVELSTDDAWMRDAGPTFVLDGRGRRRGVDWHFNAWGGLEGGLYHPWDRDERVAAKVLELEGADRYRAPLILEGGSIHCDGEGTVLTTEECLLNHNRNPELTREEIERLLLEYLGAERVVWLGRGLPEDETDGHVDNLACFVSPGRVLLSWSEDPEDPMSEVSRDAEARLRSATDARGRAFEVIRIPSPGPLYLQEAEAMTLRPGSEVRRRLPGERLGGSYVNFYPAIDRVVYPLLDDRHDERAAEILAACFPGREVVGVPSREILLGGGNIHCITQQVPANPGALDGAPSSLSAAPGSA
jgi:agmatine deiminase